MNSAINAWKEIDCWLKLRHRTQSNLASHLGISASAVTQIKKGINLLSAEQLRAVIEYLEIDDSAAEEICCAIFRARLGSALPQHAAKLRLMEENSPRSSWPMEMDSCKQRLIPQLPLGKLRWFEPALESAESFIARNADGMAQVSGGGDFLLTGLPGSPETLRLSCSRPVQSGETIFVKLRDGRMLSGFFRCARGQAELHVGEPFCRVLRWQRGTDVNFFFWAFPVCPPPEKNEE